MWGCCAEKNQPGIFIWLRKIYNTGIIIIFQKKREKELKIKQLTMRMVRPEHEGQHRSYTPTCLFHLLKFLKTDIDNKDYITFGIHKNVKKKIIIINSKYMWRMTGKDSWMWTGYIPRITWSRDIANIALAQLPWPSQTDPVKQGGLGEMREDGTQNQTVQFAVLLSIGQEARLPW